MKNTENIADYKFKTSEEENDDYRDFKEENKKTHDNKDQMSNIILVQSSKNSSQLIDDREQENIKTDIINKEIKENATPISKPDDFKSQITVISLEIEGNLSNFYITGNNLKEDNEHIKVEVEVQPQDTKKSEIDQHNTYDQRRVVGRSNTFQINNNINNDIYYCHKCSSFSCYIL